MSVNFSSRFFLNSIIHPSNLFQSTCVTVLLLVSSLNNDDWRWAIQFSHLDKLVSRTKWTTTKCGSIQLWLSLQSHQIRMFANKPTKAVTLIQIEDRRSNAQSILFYILSDVFPYQSLLRKNTSSGPPLLTNPLTEFQRERERMNLNDFPTFKGLVLNRFLSDKNGSNY